MKLIINGRLIDNDPPPVLRNGSTLVPLRGVLENLGAVVTYISEGQRIRIQQSGRRIELVAGEKTATVDGQSTPLPTAPRIEGGRAFVPLRFLAELFGYDVSWVASTRTIAISDKGAGSSGGVAALNPPPTRPTLPGVIASSVPVAGGASVAVHRKALEAAGEVGITINFHDSSLADIEPLLDAAKNAGVRLIQTRFDWSTLEPVEGGNFNWAFYDRVVRGARERDLTLVGILGNSTKWASQLSSVNATAVWRNAPPRDDKLVAWQNYVRRVVGRYSNDVHAWQIWENPASHLFRGGMKKFYVVAQTAAAAARESDPGARIYLGEPGGVNLNFVQDLALYRVAPYLNGLDLYPLSQWQPGALGSPEAFLTPLATLQRKLAQSHSPLQHLWVAGLSFPDLNPAPPQAAVAPEEGALPEVKLDEKQIKAAFDKSFVTKDEEERQRLAPQFTAQAQADYLVRTLLVARASGAEKAFWGNLRDDDSYENVVPFDPIYGNGLLRRDFTPRPAYAALKNLNEILADKPYVGRLKFGPNIAALVFDSGKEGVVAVWALQGEPKLVFNNSGLDTGVPNAVYVHSTATSQLLSSTGRPLTKPGAGGTINLTGQPLWITKTDADVARQAKLRPAGEPLMVQGEEREYPATGVRAVFDETTPEDGLLWRKYANFRGEANVFVPADGQMGLLTQVSHDIYNPAAGKSSIFLDVADDYLFYAGSGRGEPVQVTITVARPPESASKIITTTAGFNLRYDSPTGQRFTKWQVVEEGQGWATYTFDLLDASFGNTDGYDLAINTFGSKRDLVFGSVTVKRLREPAPKPTPTPVPTPIVPLVPMAPPAPDLPVPEPPAPVEPAPQPVPAPPLPPPPGED